MFGNKEMRLLMLGLDAAGKTSMQPRFSSVSPRFNDALSYLVQAQTEPVRHNDPHRCVGFMVHFKLHLTL